MDAIIVIKCIEKTGIFVKSSRITALFVSFVLYFVQLLSFYCENRKSYHTLLSHCFLHFNSIPASTMPLIVDTHPLSLTLYLKSINRSCWLLYCLLNLLKTANIL